MARSGHYQRRRGILDHLLSGEVSLLDTGIHDYICLTANAVVGNGDLYPPGVTMTSAPALYAYCPKGISERTVRRSLDHLEKIGWIKRWMVRGRRGNYPVAVARFSVRDLSGREYRVDVVKTRDWRHPVLVPVHEASATCPQPVRNLSGSKETRNEKKTSTGFFDEEEFAKFWEIYPKKEAKPKARAAWKKIKVSEVSAILDAIGRFKQSEQWRKDGGQFIPYPASFLNQRRWEDELPAEENPLEDSREMVKARIPA